MKIKFNDGQGAILCDACNVIIAEGFENYEWKAAMLLEKTEGDWFCEKCCQKSFEEQGDKMIEMINDIAPAYTNHVKDTTLT